MERLALAFTIAIVLTWVSHTVTFVNLAESIWNQKAILSGSAMRYDGAETFIAPFYNRILFPLLLAATEYLVPYGSDVQRFLLLRIATVTGCIFIVYTSIARRQGDSTATVLLLASALFLIPTFAHLWVLPGDIFDFLFCFFAFLYIAERKYASALGVAILTAINRESGAFAAIAYLAFNYGREPFVRLAFRVGLLAILPYAAAVAIRSAILGENFSGTGQYLMVSFNLAQISAFFSKPSPVGFPFLILAMALILVGIVKQTMKDQVLRLRAFLATTAIAAISLVFGIVSEPRVFIPCLSLCLAWSVFRPHVSEMSLSVQNDQKQ